MQVCRRLACGSSPLARWRSRCSRSSSSSHTAHATTSKSSHTNITFPVDLAALSPGGRQAEPQQLIEMLSPFLLEGRVERIRKVVEQRTFNVLPIVEGEDVKV